MIGLIAKWLIGRNPALTLAHATRLARVGLIVGSVVLAVGGAFLWLHIHDKAVIERHEDKRAVKEAQDALEGEQRANRGEEQRREAREADSDRTAANMKEAENAHPDEAKAAAGPVSRAAADRLRRH